MNPVTQLPRLHLAARSLLALAAVTVVASCVVQDPALAAQRVKVVPGFNGTVNALAGPDSNGVTYVGGSFSAFNAIDTGYGTLANGSTGVVNTAFPKVSGGSSGILAVAPDGSGGYYIGGDFTAVGGVTRNRAARINADGSLADWNPNLNNSVRAIAVSGSSVYLGGNFSGANSVNGNTTRNRAAKVNDTTGAVDTSWNPNVNNAVNAIAVSGSSIYLGGAFNGTNSVNGNTIRNRAAKVNDTTGTVDANWNPNLNNTVNAIAVSGSSIYLGGAFSGSRSINNSTSQIRNYAAKVNDTMGTVDTNWNPIVGSVVIGNSVNAIAVSGSSIYLGGQFTSVNGTSTIRNRAAKVNDTTGTVDANWNPNLNSTVTAITVSGSSIYLGGAFSGTNSVNGNATRNYAAKVNDTTGAVDSAWNPNPSGTVYAIAVSGSGIYMGGQFTTSGGIARNNAAAIDSSGALTGWNPNLNSAASAIAVSGSSVYIGGAFSGANSINGTTTRNHVAKVDNSTGAVDSSWNPNINGNNVFAIAVAGSSVYIGGDFSGANSINGTTTRNRAAKVNDTTGAVDTSWDANLSDVVNAIAVSGSGVYLGGMFNGANSINGTATRNYVAKVTDATGAVDPNWDANLNGFVQSLAVSGASIYIGGWFNGANSVNGTTTRNYAAKVNDTTGAVDATWDPNLNASVYTIAVSGPSVYLGGDFNGADSINGNSTRNRAARVNDTTGAVDASWDPNIGDTVFAIAPADSSVYLAGPFANTNSVNGTTTRNRVAGVNMTTGTLTSWGTGMPSPALDTNTGTVDRGTVVKSDATTGAGSTPGTYQWQRCTSSNAADCSDIVGGGSNGAWWGSRNADIGNRVRVKAMWDTVESSLTALSALTGIFKPTATTALAIDQGLVSGAPRVGTRIHSSFGAWSGYIAGSSTVAFQWQRCTTTDASSCTTNVGTNNQWYTPVTTDAGKYLRVTATLTTNGQTATASSAVSSTVASATQARRSAARAAVFKAKSVKPKARR